MPISLPKLETENVFKSPLSSNLYCDSVSFLCSYGIDPLRKRSPAQSHTRRAQFKCGQEQCQEESAGCLLLPEEQGERAFKRMTKAAARYKFRFISLSRRQHLCLPLKSFWKLQYLSLKVKGWKWVFCKVCSSSEAEE